MAKDETTIYNNKNGYYTDEELLELKHMSDGDFINFLRTFKITTHKCPPKKYKIHPCFYCIDCIKLAINSVKEKKVK